MKRSALLITFFCCALVTHAFSGGVKSYVFAFTGFKSSATTLEKDADYLSMSLTIESKHRDPASRFAEIKEAQNLILKKAKEESDIMVHKGPIVLSPKPISKLASISSFSYSPPSTTELHVLSELDQNDDVYSCALRIRRFVDSLKLPGKSECRLGETQLTVTDPQQYRKELLELISKDVEFVRSTMNSSGRISITGLEQPVLVRQVDDRKVELFINYSMTVELPGDKPGKPNY